MNQMSTDDLLEMGMNELTNDFSEITKNESQSFCIQEPQTWFWWQNIASIAISIFGINSNILCAYLFTRRKSFSKSSYVYYLRLISLADSCSLFVELVQALNELLIMNHSHFQIYPKNSLFLKSNRFLADAFQLNTAWLICSFSIQRCVFINSPLLFRRFLNATKRKRNFILILFVAMAIQTIGIFAEDCLGTSPVLKTSVSVFSLRIYQYFNQMTCLVLIPMIIIIPCNAIVFFRILQRRRMIKSGNLHMNFKINRSGNKFTGIEMTRCKTSNINKCRINSADVRYTEPDSTDVLSAFTTDDYCSTHEDTRSMDSKAHSTIAKLEKNKKYVKRAKYQRDIKIFLLMIYSISFLAFVLPETLVKFYNFFALHELEISGLESPKLFIVFYLLKLMYFSSNFLAYLTLVAFTRKKAQIIRNLNRKI